MSSEYFEKPTDNVKYLIELVKSKPELYDPKHSLYTHRYAHANAWRDIAGKLKVPVYEFRSKWSSIRNSYARVLRKRIKNPDTPKWYLEENMLFLKPVINARQRIYNKLTDIENSTDLQDDTQQSSELLSHNEEEDEEEEHSNKEDIENNATKSIDIISLEDDFDDDDDDDDNYNEEEIEQIKLKKLNKKYKKTKTNLKEFDKIFDFLTNYFNDERNINNNNNNNDFSVTVQKCNDLFFQSMQKDYEKLPEQKKRKFKLITLSAINELLDEED